MITKETSTSIYCSLPNGHDFIYSKDNGVLIKKEIFNKFCSCREKRKMEEERNDY